MHRLTHVRLAVAFILATVASASHVAGQRRETTTVTRLYMGADGQSHAEDTGVVWRPAKLRAELNESESVKVFARADRLHQERERKTEEGRTKAEEERPMRKSRGGCALSS
jgi:hypothetical protein